jgi:hypothetical protein
MEYCVISDRALNINNKLRDYVEEGWAPTGMSSSHTTYDGGHYIAIMLERDKPFTEGMHDG